MNPIKIGISIGDINGIGAEVILKTLSHKHILDVCTPVIYSSSKVISYHKNIVNINDLSFVSHGSAERLSRNKINVINCWVDNVNIELGKITEDGGKYAYISMDSAVRDLKEGKLDALVTAPIHKQAMSMANFPYKGHTDYLTAQFDQADTLMLMVSDNLRVGVITEHIPISEVANTLTKELISSKIKTLIHALKFDFGIDKPTIAILGLNPHAGDGGLMGSEEDELIRPAIIEAKKNGELVMGPYSADGFFGSGLFSKMDGILAMYHDQGLVPFKTLAFGTGVNFTAGLPIVRTSPGHGTGFEIAGKNEADSSSFTNAMFMAIDAVRNRKEYKELRENSISKKPKPSEKEQESS